MSGVWPATSHLLGVHGTLGALRGVGVQPQDGLVAHGTHAADLQPFEQAPERKRTEVKVDLLQLGRVDDVIYSEDKSV